MKIIQSIKSNWKYLFLIVIFAASFRFLYSQYNPLITVASDTYGYYIAGNRILQEDFAKFIINDERTPIYPLFLSTFMKAQRLLGVPILSDEFFFGAKPIVFTQHAIGILSIILLFFILESLKVRKIYAFLFSLFMAVNPLIFFWERTLLPETLSSFFLLLITFIFIKGLEKKKTIYFFLFLPTFIFGFLLKPVYILLPVFLLVIIPVFYRTKKSFLFFFLASILSLSIPYFYIKRNEASFGFRGINHSSDINLLGKILKFKLSVEEAKDIKYYYENIKDYRSKNENPMPYRFLEYYDTQIYNKKELLNLLPEFNFKVISANYKEFIVKSFQEFPKALLDTSEIIASKNVDTPLGIFFLGLFELFKKLQYLYFLALLLFPISIFQFIRKSSFSYAAAMFLGIISVYQIFFSIFFSYGEFGRLIAPAQPIIYLFVVYELKTTYDKFLTFLRYPKRTK